LDPDRSKISFLVPTKVNLLWFSEVIGSMINFTDTMKLFYLAFLSISRTLKSSSLYKDIPAEFPGGQRSLWLEIILQPHKGFTATRPIFLKWAVNAQGMESPPSWTGEGISLAFLETPAMQSRVFPSGSGVRWIYIVIQ
jgi:hypothetical protein